MSGGTRRGGDDDVFAATFTSPSTFTTTSGQSELLIDLRCLPELRQIMLALAGHRFGGQLVADLLLHLGEGARGELAAVLDRDQVVAAVVAAGADQAEEDFAQEAIGGILELGEHLSAPEVAEVAAFLGN